MTYGLSTVSIILALVFKREFLLIVGLKRIFTHCGARLDGTYPGDRVWSQFCNDLGWSKNNNYVLYKEMDFSMSAPPGHLPHLCAAGFVPKSWEGYRFLLSREEI